MPLPFVGKTYRYDYGGFVAVNSFAKTEINFVVVEGPFKGLTGKAAYTAREVAPSVYAISWQETDGATVVHLDDFKTGICLSFFTDAGLNFFRMEGTFTQLADAITT